jgi:hypothetical protein
MTLNDLLSAETVDACFGKDARRRPRHMPGQQMKFACLFDWPKLNLILSHHVLDPPRLQLVLAGRAAEPSAYTQPSAFSPFRSSLTHAVYDQMKAGATLVLNGADELDGGLTELARDVERRLSAQAAISVEACTATPTELGNKPAWQTYDMVVLQVTGSYRWLLLGETQSQPLDRYSGFMQEPPLTEPELEVVSAPGDALYIPRGHWYSAEPVGVPALDVVVCVSRPATWNFASWLLDRMKADEILRTDVPLQADEVGRSNYLQALRRVFQEALQDDGLVEEFAFCWNGMAAARPRFSLPTGGEAGSPAFDGCEIVRVLPSRPFAPREVPGENVLDTLMNGRFNRFHIEAKEILNFLMNQEFALLRELQERFAETYTREQISDLVGGPSGHRRPCRGALNCEMR